MKCDVCDLSSPIESFFTRLDNNKNVCPSCHNTSVAKYGKLTWLGVLLGLPIGHLILAYNPNLIFLGIFLLIPWVALFIFISIMFHEIGHYLATKITGGICPVVTFGEGPELFTIKTKNMLWKFCVSPTLGLAYCAYPKDKQHRWRYAVMLSSGFIANILLMCVSFIVVLEGVPMLGIENRSILPLIFAIVNGLLAYNAMFSNFSRPGLLTDGNQIRNLFKDKESYFNHSEWNYQFIIASALVYRDEPSELREYITSCEDYELSALHLSLLSYADSMEYNYENYLRMARQSYSLLIDKKENSLPPQADYESCYAMIANNLAFALFSTDHKDYGEMLTYAEQAYERLPWEPAVVGTYAATLIRTNKNVNEGVQLLEKLIDSSDWKIRKKTNIAINCLCLAEGYNKKGNIEKAKATLNKVKNLDEQVYLKMNFRLG